MTPHDLLVCALWGALPPLFLWLARAGLRRLVAAERARRKSALMRRAALVAVAAAVAYYFTRTPRPAHV